MQTSHSTPVLRKRNKRSPNHERPRRKLKLGHLLKMVLASRGSIGSLLASSFCERINSARNIVMTKGNTLLGDEELNMLVVLRMNREFMKVMRTHFPHVALRDVTVTEKDNEEDVDIDDYDG